jgi:surfactin synthase thioesterase subunit
MMSTEPLTLVCLPHAGGSARGYLRWQDALGPWLEIVPLDMPGRWRSRKRPAASTLREAAAALLPDLKGLGRYAIFGHSMGGLLGYELARLACAAGIGPECLVAAACRAPDDTSKTVSAGLPELSEFSDDQLLDHLSALGTVPAGLRDSPMRGLFLPALRADLELVAGYVPAHDAEPLPIRVQAWYGTHDGLVPGEAAERWQRFTTGGCSVRAFPGDHFFVQHETSEITKVIGQHLFVRP